MPQHFFSPKIVSDIFFMDFIFTYRNDIDESYTPWLAICLCILRYSALLYNYRIGIYFI